MSLTRETNHRAALLQLAGPLWGKPRIAALLTALLDQVQRIEDDIWDILEARTLDNADLVRLKVLGKLVGQPRLGFALEDYRSQGRALDLVEVAVILLGEANFSMVEGGNATLYITALTPLSATDVAKLAIIFPDTRAAGVGMQLLFGDPVDAEDLFRWGDLWSTDEEWAGVALM